MGEAGEAVPAKWVAIRADIKELAKQRPTLSLDQYLATLVKKGIVPREEAESKAANVLELKALLERPEQEEQRAPA